MYQYKILQDGFKIGIARGKFKAFEFVNKILERESKLGIWFQTKCETDTNVYQIERDY